MTTFHCYDPRHAIVHKGLKIIESCKTREHCLVTHNWLKLAEKELFQEHIHTLNEAYLTKILKVTKVI